jgi:hypothetical protein
MEMVIKKFSTRLNNFTLIARFACVMKKMAYVDRAVTSPDYEGEGQNSKGEMN